VYLKNKVAWFDSGIIPETHSFPEFNRSRNHIKNPPLPAHRPIHPLPAFIPIDIGIMAGKQGGEYCVISSG